MSNKSTSFIDGTWARHRKQNLNWTYEQVFWKDLTVIL